MQRSVLSFLVVAISVACKGQSTLDAAPPAPPPSIASSPSPAPLPAPKVERHNGITVKLLSDKHQWEMQETEPYLVPDTAARPVTIILHSISGDSVWPCDWLQYGRLEPQWQLCPQSPRKWNYMWNGPNAEMRQFMSDAIATLKQRRGARVSDEGVVMVGLSGGGYALDMMLPYWANEGNPLKIRGLVVHGADVHFETRHVKALGARVVFLAGDQDGASHGMRATIARLERAGINARYISLGSEGHFIPVGTANQMSDAINWSRAAN